MSPDFFARYLSLASKPSGIASANAIIPPSALHLASLGLVPSELREDAEKAYNSFHDQPEYLRRRRLRDLLNRAIATAKDEDDIDVMDTKPPT